MLGTNVIYSILAIKTTTTWNVAFVLTLTWRNELVSLHVFLRPVVNHRDDAEKIDIP